MKWGVLLVLILASATAVSWAEKDFEDDGEEYPSLEIPQLKDFSAFGDFLTYGFYQKSCPGVEGIIHRKVKQWFDKDNTIAAGLLRLHFHDCVVRVNTALSLPSFFSTLNIFVWPKMRPKKH